MKIDNSTFRRWYRFIETLHNNVHRKVMTQEDWKRIYDFGIEVFGDPEMSDETRKALTIARLDYFYRDYVAMGPDYYQRHVDYMNHDFTYQEKLEVIVSFLKRCYDQTGFSNRSYFGLQYLDPSTDEETFLPDYNLDTNSL